MKWSFYALFLIIYTNNTFADWVGNSIRFGSPIVQSHFISKEREIIFEPNPLSEITLSFIGPSYAFGLQFAGENEDDGDLFDSGYSDFLISYYSKSYIIDLFYRSFEDFYVQDDRDEMIASGLADTIKGGLFGLQAVYYPEGDIFKIHGENVLDPQTGFAYFYKFRLQHQNIEGSDKLIPTKYQSDFLKIKDVKGFSADSIDTMIGMSGLYASESFYINSFLMLGPSYESYLIEQVSRDNISLISPVAEAFMGVAYYQKNFQLGYRVLLREKFSQINGVEFRDVMGTRYFYILMIF